MIAEYKTKTNIGVGLGIILQIAGRFVMGSGAAVAGGLAGPELGLILILGGVVAFIYGCRSYAKGKGHHPAWGFLGLLSIVGLIILVFLPDKHKQ